MNPIAILLADMDAARIGLQGLIVPMAADNVIDNAWRGIHELERGQHAIRAMARQLQPAGVAAALALPAAAPGLGLAAAAAAPGLAAPAVAAPGLGPAVAAAAEGPVADIALEAVGLVIPAQVKKRELVVTAFRLRRYVWGFRAVAHGVHTVPLMQTLVSVAVGRRLSREAAPRADALRDMPEHSEVLRVLSVRVEAALGNNEQQMTEVDDDFGHRVIAEVVLIHLLNEGSLLERDVPLYYGMLRVQAATIADSMDDAALRARCVRLQSDVTAKLLADGQHSKEARPRSPGPVGGKKKAARAEWPNCPKGKGVSNAEVFLPPERTVYVAKELGCAACHAPDHRVAACAKATSEQRAAWTAFLAKRQ